MNYLKITFRVIFFSIIGLGAFAFPPPLHVDLQNSFYPAFHSIHHPLGCDRLGRDIFSLFVFGSIGTLLFSLPARFLTLAFSSILSLLGYSFNSLREYILTPLSSVFLSLPSLLIALVFIQIFGATSQILIVSLLVSDWAQAYESIQGRLREVGNSGYVTAAYCFGGGTLYAFRRHILPDLMGVLSVLFSTGLPAVIMTLALFSYLGIQMGNELLGPGLGEQIAFSQAEYAKAPLTVWVPVLGIIFLVYSLGRNKDSK